MAVRAPDHRLISKKDIFFLTKKFYELLDSNVLMSDTKTINWWKHKKNYQIPFLKKTVD